MNTDRVQIVGNGVVAEIALLGAELQVLRNTEGANVMWQVDEQYWNRVAPNLFPIVGRLVNDSYTMDGVSYAMRQHGFARDQRFEVLEKEDSSVLLGLRSSEVTLGVYPFHFHFQVRYRFEEKVLWVDYITENTGEVPMLYSVGGHPGFALQGALEGHSLLFSMAGERVGFAAERRLIEGGYYSGATKTVDVANGVLVLTDGLFESDAIVFNEPVFDAVTLVNAKGEAMVDFYCWEWDAVGFWTKPGAPFFCIEPWWGWADSVNSDGDFRKKAGLHSLEAGAVEQVSYGLGLR
ncbi:MAG: hypothetical protein RL747_1426 [Bacteroidota bacterium]|jgi:galactose mutarotase-like enzyme|nr:aldose 1-epimerase family protein [Bacteroidia bacterium]